MKKTIRHLSIAVSLAVAVGCSGPDDPWQRAAIEGQVTLDGQPLSEGQITFFPADSNTGPAAGGTIQDGAYSIAAADGPVVGSNRIEIRSVQKTGRLVKSPVAVEGDGAAQEGMMVEEYADIVPKRYNTYSELKAEIQAGDNQRDFALEGSPASTTSNKSG